MSMFQIRAHYGVPAYRGARVEFRGQPGRITGTSRSAAHLRVRLDGQRRSILVHPTWELAYLAAASSPVGSVPETEQPE